METPGLFGITAIKKGNWHYGRLCQFIAYLGYFYISFVILI
jgi:hypothetical protein